MPYHVRQDDNSPCYVFPFFYLKGYLSFIVPTYALHMIVSTSMVRRLGFCMGLMVLGTVLRAHVSPYHFKHLGKDQGLSYGTVWAIAEDQTGFMWFGTTDGLNRYDGSGFKIYRNILSDSTSLSENTVLALLTDSRGNLWVGTKNGLNKYNPSCDCFSRYKSELLNIKSLSSDYITDLFEDSNQNLWISTSNGINKFDYDTQEFLRYVPNEKDQSRSLSAAYVYDITQDHEGYLWIGTQGGGLNKFNPISGEFHHYLPDENEPGSLGHETVRCVYEDSNWDLWVGTEFGLDRFDRKTQNFTHYRQDPDNKDAIKSNHILSIIEDHQKRLWIGTGGSGLNLFVPYYEAFWNFKKDPFDQLSLNGDVVRCIFEDSKGDLWIGLFTGGIDRLASNQTKFLYMQNRPNDPNSLINSEVQSFYKADSSIVWIGTEGGLCKYDHWEHTLKSYTHDKSDPESISANEILSIHKDSKGNFWIGTLFGGLNRFDEASETFERFMPDSKNPASLANPHVWDILEDGKGNLWLATFGGLHRFDYENKIFYRYQHDPYDPNSIGHDKTSVLLEDHSGKLWIGTENGLSWYDRQLDRFQTFRRVEGDSTSLASNLILSLFEDSGKQLWIGTNGGLNLFDPKNQTFTKYHLGNPTTSKMVNGIIEDEQGYLWITTNEGLMKFDPSAKKTIQITDDFSYLIEPFKQNSNIRYNNGEIFLGGANGLVIFHPELINDNEWINPVVLTDFQIFNQSIKPGSEELSHNISVAEQIDINYDQNVISFSFTMLNYRSPEKNQYAFKLEPFEKEWQYVGGQTKAVYTNLDPGEYIFKVKASNNSGIWNEEGASIKLSISPPFWATWWFRILLAFLFIRLLVAIFRFSNRVIRKHSAELKKEVDERKLVQNALMENEARTKLLLDSAFDGIVILQNDKIRESNQAFLDMFELKADQKVSLNDLIQPGSQMLLAKHLRTGFNRPYELKGVTSEGSVLDLEVVSRKCIYHGQEAKIIALRDITNRKAAEEAELKVEKLKSIGTLAGGIAHDFNNILLGVFANISMVQKELPKNNAGAKFLEEAAHAMNRASGLTKQLLTFAKGGEPIKEFINLAELVEDVVKFDLSGSDITPVFEIEKDLWAVQVDKGQIQQVISNLTINAKQAMSGGGHLYISIANLTLQEGSVHGLDPGKYQKIVVRDEGDGISKENLDKIFDPYFTTKQLGSGLGLATTYSIVNKHRGNIEVSSVAGKGTTFTILIPATDMVISKKVVSQPIAVSDNYKGKILVMDDLDMLRSLVRGILERYGYSVETVSEGQEAIDAYRLSSDSGQPFDAVIMDLNVPEGLGGREAIRQILNIDPKARVIASSGYAGDSTLANFSEYGFKGIITKPYTNEDLINVIDQVLSA